MKAVRLEMPTIEKGIPCPFKNHPKTYRRKSSMWDTFLRQLEPNDSFLVEERELQNLTHIGRQKQMLLVFRRGPNEALKIPADRVRVWLAPTPEPEKTHESKVEKLEKLVQEPGPKVPTSTWSNEDIALL